MTPINFPAVRALSRALRPVQEARELAERADAGFDAGEWSGPLHAEAAEQEAGEMAAKVGQRCGLSADDLLDQYSASSHHQEGYWMQALQERVEGRAE